MSLTANAGTITALLGPNGAGKSTLLSIAATLLRPTSGRVEYGECDAATGGAPLRARIGMLGHDLYLYSELTAAENLRFFAKVYALDAIEGRVDAALERAGLTERRDDIVAGFSRGMRQRLALERSLKDYQMHAVCLFPAMHAAHDGCTTQARAPSIRRSG